ncbi:transglycosylase SLT domain-containing protein [Shewanella avicenniae]|uniref:Transglycosylase SLT domain-containing protein n=1 Tax=Shewanella avicenniae TaxID=2814294 RepID=A0ABX7QUX3_9GAMM|nr:transglycosylase SLT domain-containing protein [Shewanella avicenniae]QSX35311.1 transglycosylase SLT domain-containing protein [Shewanella avicenniae]
MEIVVSRKQTLIHLAISGVLLSCSALVANEVNATDYTAQRKLYLQAREAQQKNKSEQYQQLRQQLNGYPLTLYLDFHDEQDELLKLKGDKAVTELANYAGSPLYGTLKHRYLENAADKRRWQDFLAISPTAPRSDNLECAFYVAKFQTGQLDEAWKGARALWLSGQSQPKACDPLFDAWSKAGLRTDEMIWQRIILSFDNGQSRLLSYLVQHAGSYKLSAELLYKVYSDPRELRHIAKFDKPNSVYADIVRGGLMRLAVKDLTLATNLFDRYRDAGRFNAAQQAELQHFLLYRSLLNREGKLEQYVDERLAKQPDDVLIAMRIRWALADNNLAIVKQFLPLLTAEEQADSRWLYWRVKLGLAKDADAKQLLQTRNFYGFTAAFEQGVAPQLQPQAVADIEPDSPLLADAGLLRVIELIAIDKTIDAKLEWRELMQRHSAEEQIRYGGYALKQGWYDLSVDSSISAKAWDYLALRFPEVQTTLYDKYSKQFNADKYQLMSIARRESAFYPYATSGAGARGFMQLMPDTAKRTAQRYKLTYNGTRSLYEPEINIPLGSAYFGGLLKQFDGNRVLATAAYNAGPYRIKQWLKKSAGKLDVMAFIESIPYRETREYVQGVFSYRMIYEQQQQLNKPFFTEKEYKNTY